MSAMYEQPFNRMVPPFAIVGDPLNDPALVVAVQRAYDSPHGLSDFDIEDWMTGHMSHLLQVCRFTQQARTNFGFAYIWVVMFGFMLTRELEQDNALRFKRPFLPFGLTCKAHMTNEQLYLLHVAAFARALGNTMKRDAERAPEGLARFFQGSPRTSENLARLFMEAVGELSAELPLSTEASGSLVRDTFMDGRLVREAVTNDDRWFANIADLSLRYSAWPGRLP